MNRLNPPRSSRIFYHLTSLRLAIEMALDGYLPKHQETYVLDYGCGDMPYRPLFQEIGARYEGHDLSRNTLAHCSLISDGTLDCIDNCVDVVLSSQVLEHVDEPNVYLRESFRVLKAQGLLLLTTHGVWKFHPDPNDYWRWTSSGLKKQVEAAGFEILEFTGIVGPAATGIQLWQDATLPRVPRLLHKPFCYVLQILIRRADAKCSQEQRDNDASVFLCVARKRA